MSISTNHSRRWMLSLGLLLSFGGMLLSSSGYAGVEINRSRSAGPILWATLSGAITKNTVKEIEAALSEAGDRHLYLELNSDGGDWEAAMAIGRRLHSAASIAQVSDGAACASACVLVLGAAQVRVVSARGRVAIHRPYSTSTVPISLEQSQGRFRVLAAATRDYLREMNLPDSLFEAMVRVPPESLRLLTPREIDQFGLEGKDPAYAETVDTQNANALGIDKREYLRRKARADLLCSDFERRIERTPKQKTDEILSLGEKWMQCKDLVMRGERK